MFEVEGFYWYLGVGGAALTTAVSLLLIYPLFAYARNVAHTEAFVMLSLAFFCVTVVAISQFLFGMMTVANAFRFVGAGFALTGTYFFARDFVRVNAADDDFFGEGGFFD